MFTIGKEHFTYLYKPAREQALTTKNIKASFAASGLLPLNPDRMLRTVSKPPTEVTRMVNPRSILSRKCSEKSHLKEGRPCS